jgi:hypothetical protein
MKGDLMTMDGKQAYAVGDVVMLKHHKCRGLVADIDDEQAEFGGRYVIAVPGSPVAVRSGAENLEYIRHGTEFEQHMVASVEVAPAPFKPRLPKIQ